MKTILVIGHRGAMGYEPENTLRSFQKAIALGVDVIELDVHLSKDNELIVIHDENVDRTTNGKGYVKDSTMIELKRLVVDKNEKVPTLQEVFDLVKKKAIIDIEIKAENCEKPLVDVIKKNKMIDKIIISSFNIKFLKNIKKINRKIKTGLLYYGEIKDQIENAKKIGCKLFLPNYKFVDGEIVKKTHKAGMKIMVWNLEDKDDIKNMIGFGVDGIASNKPDIIVSLLNK